MVTSIKDEDGAAETSSLNIMRSDYDNLKELNIHIYYNNASTTGKSQYTNYVVAGIWLFQWFFQTSKQQYWFTLHIQMVMINAWSTTDTPIYNNASTYSEISCYSDTRLFVACTNLRAIHAFVIGY